MTPDMRAAVERQARKERDQKRDLVVGVHNTRAKIDPDKLTVDECQEMKSLHRKALDVQPDGNLHRTDLAALSDRERKRFQELLDKALPDHERERQRALRAERDRRVLVAFADEVANEGVPPLRRLGLRSGEALLPADAFFGGVLHVGDLGLLALLAHVWSSGTAGMFKGGRWSDDGRALLLPKRPEFAGPGPEPCVDDGSGADQRRRSRGDVRAPDLQRLPAGRARCRRLDDPARPDARGVGCRVSRFRTRLRRGEMTDVLASTCAGAGPRQAGRIE